VKFQDNSKLVYWSNIIYTFHSIELLLWSYYHIAQDVNLLKFK